MTILLTSLAAVALGLAAFIWYQRQKARQEVAKFSVSPVDLHAMLGQQNCVLILDVRHPLDLLADPHIIPGSVRIAPKDVMANPALVPFDRDVVFYCTCPSDETSRNSLHRARETNHLRVKFLRGGLAAWKAQGFPVETYETAFHLDTL